MENGRWLSNAQIAELIAQSSVEVQSRYIQGARFAPAPTSVSHTDALWGANLDIQPAQLEREILESLIANSPLLGEIGSVDIYHCQDDPRNYGLNFFLTAHQPQSSDEAPRPLVQRMLEQIEHGTQFGFYGLVRVSETATTTPPALGGRTQPYKADNFTGKRLTLAHKVSP